MNDPVEPRRQLPRGEINPNEYQMISFDNIDVGKYYYIKTDPAQNDIPYYFFSKVLRKNPRSVVVKTLYYKYIYSPMFPEDVLWNEELTVPRETIPLRDIQSGNFTFWVPKAAIRGGRRRQTRRRRYQ
jgi:hypothetical protein